MITCRKGRLELASRFVVIRSPPAMNQLVVVDGDEDLR